MVACTYKYRNSSQKNEAEEFISRSMVVYGSTSWLWTGQVQNGCLYIHVSIGAAPTKNEAEEFKSLQNACTVEPCLADTPVMRTLSRVLKVSCVYKTTPEIRIPL